jgi:hypothetical protein
MNHKFKHFIIRFFLSTILLVLGCWTAYSSWPQRSIRYNRYTYSDIEERRLNRYPNALYAYGMRAWQEMQPVRAATFFRQAVSRDVLYLDAWLKLAESEVELGREKKAAAILLFTTRLTDQVFRWKWPQILLARELGMDTVFCGNIIDLLSRKMLVQDALQLLHTHFQGEASAVIAVLGSTHLAAYLDWLMRWGMPDESALVWQAMTAIAVPDETTALRYASFLLDHKRTAASRDIWQRYTGNSGLTNAGFEKDITGRGFDWRHWGEKEGAWSLKRVKHQTAEGDYALKITFNGQENISFQHIYQIMALAPQKRYRLTYAWKSRGITTDQGPFMEIFGYEQKGLYQAGPMITGSQGWQEEAIVFETPVDCRAAVMRLRRRASMRFDSKIKGVLWIDDFRLDKIEADAH